MIRADHEISNEEERSYHDQLQPVRTILAVARRLPPPSLEAQTSGTGGVVEPEENIQSEHYSFSSGQTSQFTVQI